MSTFRSYSGAKLAPLFSYQRLIKPHNSFDVKFQNRKGPYNLIRLEHLSSIVAPRRLASCFKPKVSNFLFWHFLKHK